MDISLKDQGNGKTLRVSRFVGFRANSSFEKSSFSHRRRGASGRHIRFLQLSLRSRLGS